MNTLILNELDQTKADAVIRFGREAKLKFGIVAAIILYLIFVSWNFSFISTIANGKGDAARTLVSDIYSYKTEITRSNRGDRAFDIAIEGEKKGRYDINNVPSWVKLDGQNATILLPKGAVVNYIDDILVFDMPNYGEIFIEVTRRGISLETPDGEIPEFISVSRNRVDITTPYGRVIATKSKSQVFRYFGGWELFFFTLDSPFYDKGLGEIISLALSSERVVADKSNISAMWYDFWHNPMWRHADVAWAIYETLLMAFLGTFGAAIISIFIAFLAAQNFTPSRILRQVIRRLLDFLRGVDGLIWTIILSRAFGPGPLTGALAILLTDTGTFGKTFSEALENVDSKQIDGVRSTGANPVQKIRFGVIPQIIPVLLSQILYYLESNTRSATIIGAIVGGGIGLLLTQAIITGKDWEEVTYYIILIVLLVMFMDTLSGWLRRKLIKD